MSKRKISAFASRVDDAVMPSNPYEAWSSEFQKWRPGQFGFDYAACHVPAGPFGTRPMLCGFEGFEILTGFGHQDAKVLRVERELVS